MTWLVQLSWLCSTRHRLRTVCPNRSYYRPHRSVIGRLSILHHPRKGIVVYGVTVLEQTVVCIAVSDNLGHLDIHFLLWTIHVELLWYYGVTVLDQTVTVLVWCRQVVSDNLGHLDSIFLLCTIHVELWRWGVTVLEQTVTVLVWCRQLVSDNPGNLDSHFCFYFEPSTPSCGDAMQSLS